MKYTELQVTSNFSFLRGGSHPEELVEQAVVLGYTEIAIADHNTLAGIVRAHVAAKKTGIRLIIGCHLELLDGTPLSPILPTKGGMQGFPCCFLQGICVQKKGNAICINLMYTNIRKE